MSQIKYLVSAFLLLLLLSSIGFALAKLSSTEFIARKSDVVDYIEPDNTITPAMNSEGKNLFSANCATCHALDKALTGPGLRGVEERGPWMDRKNTIAWVKNPGATIPRFAYTRELAANFNGQIMPSFFNLTDAQIEAILDYIRHSPTAVPMPSPVAVN